MLGFVEVALKIGLPIVSVAVVKVKEIYPKLAKLGSWPSCLGPRLAVVRAKGIYPKLAKLES